MANQHFELNLTQAHARIISRLIRDCTQILDTSTNLKLLCDELTAGGTVFDGAEYLSLFGLPDATAGAALYPLLQSIMGGSLVKANFIEFDQGVS